MRTLLLICLWCALASAAAAQPDSSARDVERFLARARQATERFKDIDVAVAESYVKLGPDFPAMGEHWVKGELIMVGELDAARPAILTYATIDGKQTLTGAVYAIALRRGESPPLLPDGAGSHDHVGSIDEESLLFGHDRRASDDDIRLVVMHAWIWLRNPAGSFATDNWALPFARLGLQVPASRHPEAARALALLGSASYYARLFESVGELKETEVSAVSRVLDRHRAAVDAWWSSRAKSAEVSSTELANLDATWARLRVDVLDSVGAAAAKRLSGVLAAPHH